jgi:ribosome-binding ATPase YchF (GTP1/OBG family)
MCIAMWRTTSGIDCLNSWAKKMITGLETARNCRLPRARGAAHEDNSRHDLTLTWPRELEAERDYSFDDLVETGSVAAARAAGKARLEGKDYIMQDGDVVEFRFNV